MASQENNKRPVRRTSDSSGAGSARRSASAGASSRSASSRSGGVSSERPSARPARGRSASDGANPQSATGRTGAPRKRSGTQDSARTAARTQKLPARSGSKAASSQTRSIVPGGNNRSVSSDKANTVRSKKQGQPSSKKNSSKRGFFNAKRIFVLALALVAVIGVGAVADHFINRDKIYSGVFIGEVDVSGKTATQAKTLVEQHYGEKVSSTRVIIYSSEDIVDSIDVDTALRQEEALAEQISVETARENKQIWVANAESLGASVASKALVDEALSVGREDGGLLARLGAKLFKKELPVRCDYDEDLLAALADDIDVTLGVPCIDGNIVIEEGKAVVVAGQDGNCMDREAFRLELDAALLSSDTADAGIIAKVAPATSRITAEQAQAAADYVNSILGTEVSFVYEGEGWGVSKNALARWVTTSIVEKGRGWVLDVCVDEDMAKPGIVSFANEFVSKREVVVDFEVSRNSITVLTDGKVELPRVDHALDAIDEALFGPYREQIGLSHDASLTQGSYVDLAQGIVQVTIEKGTAPEEMTFEDAIDTGVIMPISAFTTEYNNNESTQNRVHNIHLAADILTNGVVQSGGGTWSFNDRAGYCGAEKGFLGAGVIMNDEVQDAVGGGICQVATTIFNAVYEAGYGIVTRHNHSLHLDAYPAGRDAAVSYSDLDLVWRNDTTSDVLMQLTYTDSSITVTLFGVDPGYEVTHRDGDWRKTKDHATKIEVDESLSPGQSIVETEGADAMQYVVFRTVADKQGNVVYEDTFYSSYGAVTEVIKVAPGDERAPKNEEGSKGNSNS